MCSILYIIHNGLYSSENVLFTVLCKAKMMEEFCTKGLVVDKMKIWKVYILNKKKLDEFSTWLHDPKDCCGELYSLQILFPSMWCVKKLNSY